MSEATAEEATARIELVARVAGRSPITVEIGEATVQRSVDGLVDEGELSDVMSQILAAASEELAIDGTLRSSISTGEGSTDGDAANC